MKRIFNHQRDTPDIRDLKFHKEIFLLSPLKVPNKFSLGDICKLPAILDQGDLGSCTANAASNSLRYLLIKNKKKEIQPSRLYIYYFTRVLQNTVNFDSGCTLRNVMKAIVKNGACDENNWKYIIPRFAQRPTQLAITDGMNRRRNFQYLSVNQDLPTIKNAIVQGFPIVIGIMVFSSFMNPEVSRSGDVPLPNRMIETLLGGHAVTIVSYDDSTKKFGLMNSWGDTWGNKGYFTLPYDYVLNVELAFDFWTIRTF